MGKKSKFIKVALGKFGGVIDDATREIIIANALENYEKSKTKREAGRQAMRNRPQNRRADNITNYVCECELGQPPCNYSLRVLNQYFHDYCGSQMPCKCEKHGIVYGWERKFPPEAFCQQLSLRHFRRRNPAIM